MFRLAMIMLSTNQLPMLASLVSVRPGGSSSRLRPRGVSSGSIASPLPSELPAPGVRCIQQAVRTGGASTLDGTLHEASVEVGGGRRSAQARRAPSWRYVKFSTLIAPLHPSSPFFCEVVWISSLLQNEATQQHPTCVPTCGVRTLVTTRDIPAAVPVGTTRHPAEQRREPQNTRDGCMVGPRACLFLRPRSAVASCTLCFLLSTTTTPSPSRSERQRVCVHVTVLMYVCAGTASTVAVTRAVTAHRSDRSPCSLLGLHYRNNRH